VVEAPAQVTIASLVKSLQSVPKVAKVQTVKLPVMPSKLSSKSLTPLVCKVSAKGITQLKSGTCRVELSVGFGAGVKVSTVKVIRFKVKS
jgi:uncharacterized protein YfaQ (DUF2300 family)